LQQNTVFFSLQDETYTMNIMHNKTEKFITQCNGERRNTPKYPNIS